MEDELSQILDYEEKSKKIVKIEQEKLDQELIEKEKKINEMLESEPALTTLEREAILAEGKREISEIESDKKDELALKLANLGRNKEEKVKSAVSHIINKLFKE